MKLNVAKWIFVVLCLLGFVFPVADALAGVVENLYYDLATTSEAELLNDWNSFGSGVRVGVNITSVGNHRYYTRNDLDLSNRETWLLDAVVSAPGLAGVGESGARLWVLFFDPDAPVVPPPPFKQLRHIQIRFEDDGDGNRHFSLVDGSDGSQMASLYTDWANTAPRYRIRLKRQKIGSDDYIFIQAEPSKSGSDINWDDPSNPNPDPDTANSKKVLLSAFNTDIGTQSEFGFGNYVAGNYASSWENIHVTIADDAGTVLPYWPPTPPTPLLTHDDKGIGNPQGIDLSADLTTSGYLTNDSAIAELDADGATYFGDVRVNPGVEQWDFDTLGDNQTVYGRVVVSDVSGRSTTGSDGSAVIPNRTAIIPTLSEWGMISLAFLLLAAGFVVIRRRREQ